MKKYIKYLSVIIVLIVASLPLSAQDKVIKKLVDGENQRIVIYGTSLSASKEGWPAMLEDSLNMLYPELLKSLIVHKLRCGLLGESKICVRGF